MHRPLYIKAQARQNHPVNHRDHMVYTLPDTAPSSPVFAVPFATRYIRKTHSCSAFPITYPEK